jgi:hypothetical protein
VAMLYGLLQNFAALQGICPVCSRKFSRPKGMRIHLARAHKLKVDDLATAHFVLPQRSW